MARILRLSPILLLTLVVGCFSPDPAKQLTNMPQGTGFILRESNGPSGRHKYSIFLPRSYAPGTPMPTIVFLHGIGESGSDGKKCTTVGIGPAIAARNGTFDFIVIFPQTGFNWANEKSEQIALDALADAEKDYAIDTARVSLTGMSSGGKGTWWIGGRHPEIFSAIVPMGGFDSYESVPQLRNMPIWALHNSGDWVVPVGGTRQMVQQIRAAGNANIHYSEFDQGGHNCWDTAYDKGELFTWLKAQRLLRM